MIPATIPAEQRAPTPLPRRTVEIVGIETNDWHWRFVPPVPDAVRPRLAELAAELADHRALRDELNGWPRFARDLEWELSCIRQEQLAALAFGAALALGYRLAVLPAVGRPREREDGGAA